MLQNLASYFLGGTTTNTGTAGGVNNSENSSNRVVLRTTDHDDGWTMVDRDSEGNSDAYSSEEDDNSDDGLERVGLERTRSNDSLTRVQAHDMEESWFVTPPPCFSSQTGPVQLRTSPLENLLIEHPSMSVYQRAGNRHPQLDSPTPSIEPEDEELDVGDAVDDRVILEEDLEMMVVYRLGRNPARRCTPTVHLNEMQVARTRQSQKIQLKKLAQQAARGYLKRANKAREVNGRNWNSRRKERSQGLTRSHANNNRKC